MDCFLFFLSSEAAARDRFAEKGTEKSGVLLMLEKREHGSIITLRTVVTALGCHDASLQ